jgi:hypothetical protein
MRPFDRTVLMARARRLEELRDEHDDALAIAIVNTLAASIKKSK